uniref:Reverse transcriptase domain-containing protein n=1 Tax=Cannabis sativa TaxID=3483 RepID=A0A803NJD4_CANSA
MFCSSNPAIDDELESLFAEKVTVSENEAIFRVPDDGEIKDVVFKLHPLKAPGPDGFPGIFFRKYWDIVGISVCWMVQQFFITGKMQERVNETFISLVPKTANAATFDHFRPISLCNFGYKIISRILTDRLKGCMDQLVSPFQSTFIPGRWIAESSIVAQEVLHSMKSKRGKMGVMAVKTDMSKAYDRLEWGFLARVLKANGFNSKVCTLLMECVTSVNYSILLNGAPLAPFNPNRGLRQGDPLSPFLFTLCSEVLSKLILRAERNADLNGIRVARNTSPITHLFYADDSIFFCSATVENANSLLNCLHKYERWSGQRVSNVKSGVVFSPNNRRHCREEIKGILGFGRGREFEEIKGNFQFQHNQPLWKVVDLFVPGSRRLNEKAIRDCFSNDIAEDILRIRILEEGEDVLFWKAEGSGKFTVKSAYWLSQQHRFNEPHLLWKKLWKTEIHPRLKHFCWKLFSDLLPTKCNLGFLQVDQLLRELCHSEVETADHLFFQCNCVRAIWFSGEIEDLDDICRSIKLRTRDFVSKTLWFDQEEENRVVIDDTRTVMSDLSDSRRPWCCKVDASVADGVAGFAGIQVIDDDVGSSKVSLGWNKVRSVLEGELLGIALALRMAKECHASVVKIEMDSLVAATTFGNAKLPYGWDTYPLFRDCLCQCKAFDKVVVCHVNKEHNVLADAIARWARVHLAEASGQLRDVSPSCGY